MKEYKHATWNSEKGQYEMCPNNPNFTDTSGIFNLDTPYYTYKMQQQGIYDDYITYRDELHEYNKSLNQEEDIMVLPVLQEPVIPESVKTFAEEYDLI